MQVILNNFSWPCDAFGLKISLKKTKVMFTPHPGEEYIELNILVYGTWLDVVDVFVYLGSVLSKDDSLDAEVYVRIRKAFVAFGEEGVEWSWTYVYMTCVVTVLLYAPETWTTHQRYIRVLEHFHLKCLRRIVNIKWQMHRPDTEVLEKALCPSLESMITTAQFRWAGNLVRIDDGR